MPPQLLHRAEQAQRRALLPWGCRLCSKRFSSRGCPCDELQTLQMLQRELLLNAERAHRMALLPLRRCRRCRHCGGRSCRRGCLSIVVC